MQKNVDSMFVWATIGFSITAILLLADIFVSVYSFGVFDSCSGGRSQNAFVEDDYVKQEPLLQEGPPPTAQGYNDFDGQQM